MTRTSTGYKPTEAENAVNGAPSAPGADGGRGMSPSAPSSSGHRGIGFFDSEGARRHVLGRRTQQPSFSNTAPEFDDPERDAFAATLRWIGEFLGALSLFVILFGGLFLGWVLQ